MLDNPLGAETGNIRNQNSGCRQQSPRSGDGGHLRQVSIFYYTLKVVHLHHSIAKEVKDLYTKHNRFRTKPSFHYTLKFSIYTIHSMAKRSGRSLHKTQSLSHEAYHCPAQLPLWRSQSLRRSEILMRRKEADHLQTAYSAVQSARPMDSHPASKPNTHTQIPILPPSTALPLDRNHQMQQLPRA